MVINIYLILLMTILPLKCYSLKNKSDTLLATTKYQVDITPYGYVKCLRTDNGTEFTSDPFQRLLVFIRIKHEQSALYSPHQNSHGAVYFQRQGVSLSSQNCPKLVGLYIDGFSVY